MTTLADALAAATERLAAADVPEPAGDARRLLAHAMGLEAGRLTLHLRESLPAEAASRFEAALTARAARRPVSHITGARLFWGRRFRVTADVLDPRPETETLVAAALEAPCARILDIGTGSGILAITLLAETPTATAVATDISPAALNVAESNAATHGVAHRLTLLETTWAEGVSGPFDLIVSNPPYIARADMAGLAPEVRDHEPPIALTDGGDGLGAYRAIATQAPGLLRPGGRLMVEHGVGQAGAVCAIFAAAGLESLRLRADLDGRERVVICSLPSGPAAPDL
ncbi:MAG: peptide chain release factor N(5)-glutamine methyltransferase [Pseudomonadota bacterium]